MFNAVKDGNRTHYFQLLIVHGTNTLLYMSKSLVIRGSWLKQNWDNQLCLRYVMNVRISKPYTLKKKDFRAEIYLRKKYLCQKRTDGGWSQIVMRWPNGLNIKSVVILNR